MRKFKKWLTTILLVVALLAGVGIMAYPFISDWWNSFHQTRAIQSYSEIVEQMDNASYESYFLKADAFNEKIRRMQSPMDQFEDVKDEYYNTLNVMGTGIIGYVTIPAISVELPIYHGTSDDVLNIAVGHLEGSSLPTGGEGNHVVLSAHRGLPTSKLFTNLDKVEEGDIFFVNVLDRKLAYRVDQILVVEPDKLEALKIEDGKDYCTLLTCTPYGVNSHRLLVRGSRTDNPMDEIKTKKEAFRIPYPKTVFVTALPFFVLMFILLMILRPRRWNEPAIEEFHEYVKEKGETGNEEK